MLHEVIGHVFGDRPVAVEPLPAGLTNHNYRVEAGDEVFVVRIAGAGTELLGIDRDREAACSRAAAQAGIGPKVVAYLPEYAALVTRFVTGKVLTAEDVQLPGVLQRIADTLRRCHAAPVTDSLGRFSVFDTIRTYIELAGDRKVPLPSTLPDALTRLAQIEAAVQSDEQLCLCHNDLLLSNLIDNGETIYLIDWEYAGLGDCFFDLGNLAVNLQLTPGQEADLLGGYSGKAWAGDLGRLRQMRLASDLREATWGFVQAAVSTLHSAAYYLDYGGRHLDRFLAGDIS